MLFISACVTCATLLILHHTIQTQVRKQISEDLQNSITTFRNVLRQRQVVRARSAGLISDLPSLKALMTSHDPATIQDGSSNISQIAGSDLFILADREGRVVAVHASTPGFTHRVAEEELRLHSAQDEIIASRTKTTIRNREQAQ